MFFYWGTRRNDTRLGYIADFCPVCRDVKPFALVCIRMVGHLYGMNLGGGRVLGAMDVCQKCGLAQEVSNADTLKPPLAVLPESLATLASETNPGLYSAKSQRLNLEERISRNPESLSFEDRRLLIKEAFMVTSNHLNLAARIASSRPAGGILAMIGLSILLGLLPASLRGFTAAVIPFVFIGCLLFSLYAVIADNLKPIASPNDLLIRALAPLNPTLGEITATLNDLDVSGCKPWSNGRAKVIHDQVAALRRQSGRTTVRAARGV